jgi:hypothetical protein
VPYAFGGGGRWVNDPITYRLIPADPLDLYEFHEWGNAIATLTAAYPTQSQHLLATRQREHSRKPDEQYAIIEACSPGPYLELFAHGKRRGWHSRGDQAEGPYAPTWKTYAYNSLVAAE